MDINGLAKNTIEQLKHAISADNVIGQTVYVDGAAIIPVSKVSFGFVTGGGEYSESTPKVMSNLPYANLSGGGASVTPMGFLVFYQGKCNYIDAEKAGDNKWGEFITAGLNLLKKEKN